MAATLMRLNNRRHFFIGFLVLLTLAVNAGVAYFNIRRLDQNGKAVAHTYAVLGQLENIVPLVEDIQVEERNFIASGNEDSLPNFRSSVIDLQTTLEFLNKSGVSGAEESDYPQLKEYLHYRVKLSYEAIKLRRSRGLAVASRLSRSKETQGLMGDIRNLVGLIESKQQDVVQENSEESAQSAQDAMRTFWIASGANIFLLLFISRLIWRAARQNTQLRSAYTDLKRAESMRDGLTEMLVHDLRTPLTTLLGPLHMLRDGTMGPLDLNQREMVSMSHNSGERLLKLINELLDISKLDAGQMRLNRRLQDAEALVQLAVGEVVRLESAATPQLLLEVQPDCTVNGDHDLLLRTLINLIGNALKFTPRDGQVTIEVHQREAGTIFSVRDTGEGIPETDLERIFDKFGQVETRKAGRKLSTGLGLTFCKLAVEAHGGKIWVESIVGQGSTFFFIIPTPEPRNRS